MTRNSLYYDRHGVTVHAGDCRDVLAELDTASVDAIVTDAPYELAFMGRQWDASGIAYSVDMWRECLRVLKPGGHLLSFGGTRTYHRMACAVEDAGFEIRDSISWLYGSGFPKSLDVSKAIDKAAGTEREVIGKVAHPAGNKPGGSALNMSVIGMPEAADITAPATPDAEQWQGWGTALKPAQEPIIVARKPLVGTVASNVQAHGTGGINVDACRVEGGPRPDIQNAGRDDPPACYGTGKSGSVNVGSTTLGRWPANVVLSHGEACDEGACVEGCPVAELDRQSGMLTSGYMRPEVDRVTRQGAAYGKFSARTATETYGDSGGASRFFPTFRWEAKAPTSERPQVGGVTHPTTKPLALMRWLVRLVTPPGGVVLDPFAGSGTTLHAARAEGFRAIGIELEPAYLPLIVARLDARPRQAQAPPAAAVDEGPLDLLDLLDEEVS